MADSHREIEPHEDLEKDEIVSRFNSWADIASTRGWEITRRSPVRITLARKQRRFLIWLSIILIVPVIYLTIVFGVYMGLLVVPISIIIFIMGIMLSKPIVIDTTITKQDQPRIIIDIENPRDISQEQVVILEKLLTEPSSDFV